MKIKATILALLLIAGTVSARQLSVLVYPFANTGHEDFEWVSAGMTATVVSDLTKISSISVISDTDRRKAMKEVGLGSSGLMDEEKAVKIGQMLGANAIFSGSYLVMEGKVRVNATLTDVAKGDVIKSVKIDGTMEDIFGLQDRVIFTLMGEAANFRVPDVAAVVVKEEERRSIQDQPRPGLSAYELYSKALRIEDADPHGALTLLKEAIELSPTYVDALILAGSVAGNTLNLFDAALENLGRAEGTLTERGERNTAGYAMLLMTMGGVHGAKGNLDKALECYAQSKSAHDRLGLQNTDGYAMLMMNTGTVHGEKGDLDKALEHFALSKSIRDRLGLQNTDGYAGLMMNTGIAHGEKGNLDKALEYSAQSKSAYDRLGLQNTAGYATLMISTGGIYQNKGELDKALECYAQSKSAHDRLGLQNTADYASLMVNTGIVHGEKGDLDKALEHFALSKSIRDRLGLQNTDGYAGLMMNTGIAHGVKGDFDKALEHFAMSKSAYDRLALQNTAGYGHLLYSLALLYEKQGKKSLAGDNFRKAYNTFVRAGYSGSWKDMAREKAERLGH